MKQMPRRHLLSLSPLETVELGKMLRSMWPSVEYIDFGLWVQGSQIFRVELGLSGEQSPSVPLLSPAVPERDRMGEGLATWLFPLLLPYDYGLHEGLGSLLRVYQGNLSVLVTKLWHLVLTHQTERSHSQGSGHSPLGVAGWFSPQWQWTEGGTPGTQSQGILVLLRDKKKVPGGEVKFS